MLSLYLRCVLFRGVDNFAGNLVPMESEINTNIIGAYVLTVARHICVTYNQIDRVIIHTSKLYTLKVLFMHLSPRTFWTYCIGSVTGFKATAIKNLKREGGKQGGSGAAVRCTPWYGPCN